MSEVKFSSMFLYLLVQFCFPKSVSFWRGLIISLELLFWSFFISLFFKLRYSAFPITEQRSVKSHLLRKTVAHRSQLLFHFQVRHKSKIQPTCPLPHTHASLPKSHKLPQRHPFPSEFVSSQETCTTLQSLEGVNGKCQGTEA